MSQISGIGAGAPLGRAGATSEPQSSEVSNLSGQIADILQHFNGSSSQLEKLTNDLMHLEQCGKGNPSVAFAVDALKDVDVGNNTKLGDLVENPSLASQVSTQGSQTLLTETADIFSAVSQFPDNPKAVAALAGHAITEALAAFNSGGVQGATDGEINSVARQLKSLIGFASQTHDSEITNILGSVAKIADSTDPAALLRSNPGHFQPILMNAASTLGAIASSYEG